MRRSQPEIKHTAGDVVFLKCQRFPVFKRRWRLVGQYADALISYVGKTALDQETWIDRPRCHSC